MRGWIRSKTRIGPVLNIKVFYRDEKYSTEVQVPSLFQDNTVSWVRIVNGFDGYVTKSMPTAKEESTASAKPIAKARPRQKPTVTLTSIFLFLFMKGYGSTLKHNDQTINSVSKCRKHSLDYLRHDQSVLRGIDGAIHYDIVEECRVKKFDDASQWLLEDWISTLAKGGGAKK